MTYWILDDQGEPVPCDDDVLVWARWFEEQHEIHRRSGHSPLHVASTSVGDVWISTVFLAIDHNFLMIGPPLLFETKVFGLEGEDSERYDCRHHTRHQALAHHDQVVAELRAKVKTYVDPPGDEDSGSCPRATC